MKKFYPILLVFLSITSLIYSSTEFLSKNNTDLHVLYVGNIFFLLLSFISMGIQQKGMRHSNPNVFVRSTMGSMMIKMFLTVIFVFIYVFFSGSHFNKRGIFIVLFFYLIYLAVEVKTMISLNKNKNA